MPDRSQVGIGLAQRCEQFVSGLIQRGVRIFRLEAINHDSVGNSVLRNSATRSNGYGRILITEDLPIVRIGKLKSVVVQGARAAARGDVTCRLPASRLTHTSRFLLGGDLLRSKRLHPHDALLGLAEIGAVGTELLRCERRYFPRDILDAVAGIGVVARKLGRAVSTL